MTETDADFHEFLVAGLVSGADAGMDGDLGECAFGGPEEAVGGFRAVSTEVERDLAEVGPGGGEPDDGTRHDPPRSASSCSRTSRRRSAQNSGVTGSPGPLSIASRSLASISRRVSRRRSSPPRRLPRRREGPLLRRRGRRPLPPSRARRMGILDGLAGHRTYLDANFFIYLAEGAITPSHPNPPPPGLTDRHFSIPRAFGWPRLRATGVAQRREVRGGPSSRPLAAVPPPRLRATGATREKTRNRKVTVGQPWWERAPEAGHRAHTER